MNLTRVHPLSEVLRLSALLEQKNNICMKNNLHRSQMKLQISSPKTAGSSVDKHFFFQNKKKNTNCF